MFRFGTDEISRVSMTLMDYVRQPRFSEQLGMAQAEVFGNPDLFADEMLVARGSMACEEALLMWFTFERPTDERGSTLIDYFLQTSSHDLTPAQSAYLERVRESCLRPYEVLAGKDSNDIAILRDLWTDEIVPLGSSVRARGARGAGMVFARAAIGANGMPELLEALAMPKAEMERALFMLRLMHHDLRKRTPELNGDDFFRSVTPWMLQAWLNSFAPPRRLPAGKRIAQMKVELDGIRPRIWRRLLVPEGIMLKALSDTLERAMGWESYHLHEFDIDGVAYGTPDPEYPLPVHTELDRRLSDFNLTKGARFDYRYDFGDGWLHRVIVEKYLQPEPGVAYPVCIDGARACPPEDVGGPGGYRDFLKILRNPKHHDHQAMKRWGRRKGRSFDPERLDIDAANGRLRKRVIIPG